MYRAARSVGEWLAWLASDAAPAMRQRPVHHRGGDRGAIGYLLSILVWRWWTVRKWRRRTA